MRAQTVSKTYNPGSSVSIDGCGTYCNSLPSVTFSQSDFSTGCLITDVNVSITWAKTDGSCSSPGIANSYHTETSFRLRAPDGGNVNLAPTGTWSGDATISSVTTVFDESSGNTASGTPVSGTFNPSGNLNNYNGESPVGDWNLRAGDNGSNDPLCIVSYTVQITAGTDLSSSISSQTNVACHGESTGSLTAAGSNGTAPYTYAWSNGGSSATISGLSAGTYTVTVSDANNCPSSTSTATITQPSSALSSSLSTSAVTCNGGSDGDVFTSTSGGTSGYNWTWSTGFVGTPLANVTAGTYTVTVTDANGCTVTGQETVSQPTAVSATGSVIYEQTFTSGTIYCAGDSQFDDWTDFHERLDPDNITYSEVHFSGTAGLTVSCTNASKVQQIADALESGTDFSVTCGGLTWEVSVGSCNTSCGLTDDIELAVDASVNDCSCNSYDAVLRPTIGNASWGGMGTICNAATQTMRVEFVANAFTGTDILCNGAADGTFSAYGSGGTSPYSYAWSTGASTQDITGLSPGTYTVTVTDAIGCTGTESGTITQPTALSTTTTGTDVSCNGGSDGTASTTASGGTSPYTYEWSTGGTSSSVSSLSQGTYTVTVTDDHGCTLTSSTTVSEPTTLTSSTSHTDVSCNGGSDGTGSVSPSGGTSPYTYLWTTSSTSSSISSLGVGTYTVTVTDNNSCTTTNSVVISQNSAVGVSASVTSSLDCFGDTDGAVGVTPSGGTGGYTYAWSTGANTNNIFGLSAGTYTATVTDGNGCTATSAVTLTQNTAVGASASVSSAIACNGGTGNVTVTPSGGTGSFTYSWNTGSTSQTVTGLSANTYSVTVTDGNGCTDSSTVTLSQNSAVGASASVSSAILCNGGTGNVTVAPSGGTGGYTYSWNTGATSQTVTGLSSNTYSVTVTDGNGCTDSSTVTLPENTAVSASASVSSAILCNGGTGNVTVAPSGGTGGYTYNWNTGATSQTVTGLSSNTYSVTVTDGNGCTDSASIELTEPNTLGLVMSSTVVICNSDGTATATISGGSNSYTYTWSNGGSIATISGLSAGTYSVTVTDNNGCGSLTDSVAVTNSTNVPVPSITSNIPTCAGSTSGSLTASVSNGIAPYTYAWSNGSVSHTISGLSAGTYTLTVTDVLGCFSSISEVVATASNPTASASISSAILCNGGTGNVTVAPSGGTGSYTYSWNTGATSQTVTGLSSNTYSVTVTDGNGCTDSSTVTLSQPTSFSASASVAATLDCNGDTDGQVTVTPSGGTSPYTYAWNTGETNQTETNIGANTYSVTVTDANGCTDSSTVTLSQPTSFSASASVTTTLDCNGDTDGQLTASESGGTSPYTYNWNTGETNAIEDNIGANTYSVTVTDANGCTDSTSVVLTQPALLVASATVTSHISVIGGADGAATVSETGGTAGYTYSWNSGETVASITGKTAATYSVTVTDANGCTDSTSVIIRQAGGALDFDGTNDYVSIPHTTALNVSSEWSFEAWIKPDNVSATHQALISKNIGSRPPSLWMTTNKIEVWYDPENAALTSASSLSAGVWTHVAATYDNGDLRIYINGVLDASTTHSSTPATNTSSYTLGQRGDNQHYYDGQMDEVRIWNRALCDLEIAANKNCELVGTESGLLAYYKFEHGVADQDNAGVTSLTDESSNSNSGTLNGFALDNSTSNWVNTSDSVNNTNCVAFSNPSIAASATLNNDVTCNGDADGSASASGSGGASYTYLWSNGSTAATLTGVVGGTYSVTITDNCGATDSASVSIAEPTQLVASASVTSALLCFGDTDGEVTATQTGGTSGYTYAWNTGETNANEDNIGANTYSVTVTDANGCTDSTSIALTQPSALVASASVTGTLDCNGDTDGEVTATQTGGTSGYTYSWNTGETSANEDNIGANTYSVTVTDANGCTDSTSIEITQPTLLSVSAAVSSALNCFGDTDGQAAATPSGGTAGYTYLWSNGATSQTATSLAAGTYSVTITDANGCTDSSSTTLTQPTLLTSAASVTTTLDCFGDADGQVTVTPSGGTAGYTYLWSNGATTIAASSLIAGTYSVTVTDANGCTDSTSIVLTQPTLLVASAAVSSTLDCFGDADGEVTVTPSGGTAGYTYLWSNGATTIAASSLTAGTYSVTVTDANGCTDSTSVVLTQPTLLSVSAAVSSALNCFGDTDGQAAATPSGGTAGYTYLWSNGATSQTATSLAAGTYSVTITDANGCTDSSSTTLTQPTLLTSAASVTTTLDCFGDADGQVTVTPSGGTAGYTYLWSNGATTIAASSLIAGTYSVTVTDANGCTDSTSIVLTQPTLLVASAAVSSTLDCFGDADGEVTVTPSGGTAGYTYLWSNGATTIAASSLTAGTYSVTVTDANGCTDSTSVVLTQPTLLVASASVSSALNCFGDADGQVTATPSGGTAGYTYLWSNGATTSSASLLSAGTYSVTVTDANGCTDSTSILLTQPTQLTASAAVTAVLDCFGDADGQATATPSGGTSTYTYLWSNSATAQTATNLAAGTYSVTITDANGCTDSTSVTLTQPTAVSSSASVTATLDCFGDADGQVTVTPSGGTAGYTYLWSTGETSATETNIGAGTYSVTVTDANGCTDSTSVVLTQPTQLDASAAVTSSLNCFGDADGQVTVTPSGGTAGYTYLWSTGETNATETDLSAGTYSVTVTDANGCTESTSIVLSEPTLLVAAAGVTSALNCFGDTDGQVTATPSGGTSGYTYIWSTGETDATETNIGAGTYSVTITDANGCTDSASIVLSEPTLLVAAASVAATLDCFGDSDGQAMSTPSGGTSPYTYLWSNSATTQTATNLTAGTYSVTITDANGCTDSASVVLTQPTQLVASGSVTGTLDCFGDTDGQVTVTPSGGTAGYTYLWSTGETSATETNIGAGTYSVTVTDANGCTDSTSVVLTQPSQLNASASVASILNCFGDSDGQVTVTPSGGTAGYTYLWSTGETNATETDLSAGTYSVTVTDANGCTDSTSIVLSEPTLLVAAAGVTSALNCFGDTDGQVTATPSGGTSGYTYIWSTGETDATETNIGAGTYSVTITDANGCTDSASIVLTQPTNLTAAASVVSILYCFGDTDGQVTSTPSGGTSPYTYAWNTGETAQTETNIGAGTYSVTITDANGCTDSASITLTQPTQLVASGSVTGTLDCFGDTDGQITVTPSGGTAGYTYLWSTGETSATETNIGVGTYSVTVTDANGCTDSTSVVLTQPSQLSASASVASILNCFGDSDGQVTVTHSGGTAGYTYLWSTGETNATETDLSAGTYSVTVTDANGCTDSTSIVLTEPTLLTASAAVTATLDCFGDSDGQATATPSGGTSPYTYLWSSGATTATATGLTAGTYTATVTDQNGCTTTASTVLSQPTQLNASVAVTATLDCFGDTDGQATVTPSGGTAGYTYLWNNGATTGSASSLSAGTYTVTVTDANGCTDSTSVVLTQPSQLSASATVASILNCFGDSDGQVTVTPSGGTAGYTYLWSTGETNATETDLSAGTYSVTVTDANGCTDSTSIVLTQPTLLVASAGVTSALNCFGDTDGQVTATPSGGTAGYTYLWSTGETNATETNIGAGTYSVTITDANGCTDSTSIALTQPAALTATASVAATLDCFGDSDGQAMSTPSGGTSPYTYLWSNSATTQTATNLTAGTYSVTITDANGCTDSNSVVLTQPTQLVASGSVTGTLDCFGDTDGQVTVTPSGGTAGYTYLWSTGETSATETNIGAGTYSVTVTDANGCTDSTSVLLTQPTLLVAAAGVSSTLNCFGDADGQVTVTPSGGTAGYTYLWSTDETNATETDLSAGTYSVTVTDANGCTDSTSIVLSEPTLLVAAAGVTSALNCFGDTDGQVTATPSGGTSGYTYIWSTGETDATETNIGAGTYSVTITDANGCTDSASIILTQPTPLTATASVVATLDCFGDTDGQVTVAPSGGTAGYTYLWNTGETDATETNIGAGTYSVTVTDANGCTDSTSAVLTQPTLLVAAAVTDTNVSCNGVLDGQATASITGGTAGYTYLWSNASITSTITGLAAGTYSVTITDANGCTDTASTVVSQPVQLVATTSLTNNVSCHSVLDGAASVGVSGGTSPYTYLWSNAATAAAVSGLAAGTYSVTVTDVNGCTDSASIVITQPDTLIATANLDNNISCFGFADGQVSASVSGGTTTYSYLWSNGATSATASGLLAGTYTVTVTDANGCTDTSSTTVSQPSALVASAVVNTNVSCFGFSDGSATASATGGITGYTYLWSNSSTNASLIGLIAGTYSVTITDANGCTDSTAVTITEPALFIATAITNTNVSCFGFADGDVEGSATGGTAPFTYLWSDGDTAAANTGVIAGTFTVTITDANGCTSSDSTTVTQPVQLVATTALTNNVSCNNGVDGAASVSPAGGTAGYTYLWSNGTTTNSASSLAAGMYSVTITDANGCTDSASIVITQPDTLIATANLDNNISCFGFADGQVSASVSGGTTTYSYLWSNGATSATTSGLLAGTYTVTVTDANGCTDTSSVAVTEPAVLAASITLDSNASCFGFTDGGLTANAMGGTLAYTYLWSNGATTVSATSLAAGTYTVTITDANGCTDVASQAITQPAVIVFAAAEDSSASCSNALDGGASTTTSGGTTPYTYLWSNGATGSFISSALPGNYAVTVTDANGCADTSSVTISVLDNVAPMAVAIDTTIYLDSNGQVSLNGQELGYLSTDNCANSLSFSLNDSAFDCTDAMLTLPIVVTADDGAGNTDTATSMVTVIDSISPQAFIQNLTVYLDSNGQASITAAQVDSASSDNCGIASLTLSITDFDCGDVGLVTTLFTVTDLSGHTDTATSSITVIDSVAPIAISQDLTVYLDNNGQASITAAQVDHGSNDSCGISALAIDISSFTCVDTGMNSVVLTATDVNGNSSSIPATITVEDTASPLAVAIDTTLYLDANGGISLTAFEIGYNSTDNCDVAGYSLDLSSFSCAQAGTTQSIVLTVTDVSGNSDTAHANVTVIDTIPPVVLTQNDTVYLDNSGQVNLIPQNFDNGSTDSCGIASYSLDTNSFDCNALGTPQPVVLTVTDNHGISDTGSAFAIVIDTVRPQAIATNLTVYLDANGSAAILPDTLDGGSTDNCAVDSLAISQSTFNCGQAGTTVNVMLYAYDASGNLDSAIALVTVADTVPPMVVTQDLTVHLDSMGMASITAAQVDNGSTDSCGIATLSLDITDFTCADVGNVTVTLTVTDIHGASATDTAVITVVDTIAPTILTQNISVYLDATGQVSITAAMVSAGTWDSCGISSVTIDTSNFSCASAGTTVPVTISATDIHTNTSTAIAQVTVLDTVAPQVFPAALTVALDSFGQATIIADSLDSASFDACGIASFAVDSTSFNCSHIGAPVVVVLTATDVNGISSSAATTVTVIDTIAPAMVTQNITVHLDNAGLASITASQIDNGSADACGINTLALDSTNFDCSHAGDTVVVTLTASDVNGNQNTATAEVYVLDTVSPTVLTQNVSVYLDSSGSFTIIPSQVDNGSFDACGIDTMFLSEDTLTCGDVGTSPISLTVVDENGNSASASASVTIIDSIAPHILISADTAYLTSAGTVVITPALFDAGTWDSCGIALLSIDTSAFDCLAAGLTFPVTFTATDVNGNATQASTAVTILDTISPTAIAQDITVHLNSAGQVSITAAMVNNGSLDNCSIDSLAVSQTDFDCAHTSPPVSVTLTAFDPTGNSDVTTANVTVLDTVSPVVITRNITAYLDGLGMATITPQMVDSASSDACGIDTMYLDSTQISCLNLNTPFTVTLTVVDSNGNSNTGTATVNTLDTVPPTAVAQDLTIYLDATGQAVIAADSVDGGSIGLCSIDSIAISQTTFDCTEAGDTVMIVFSAFDQSGNEDTAHAYITVLDSVGPDVQPFASLDVYLDALGQASITPQLIDSATTDACGVDTIWIDSSNFDCANVGSPLTVTLFATDVNDNTLSASSIINVIDTVSPEVHGFDSITVGLDSFGVASITPQMVDSASSDACGIQTLTLDSSSFTCANTGTTLGVTLTATDSNGNSSSAMTQVIIIDTISPEVFTQDITVALDSFGMATITTNQIDSGSNDACGIQNYSLDISSFDCTNAGDTVTVMLTVTDNNGNTTTDSAHVIVLDSIAPVVITQDITVELDAFGQVSITVDSIDNGTDDACGIASLSIDSSNFSCINVSAPITVTLTATDSNGNVATGTAIVTVVDNLAPVVLAQNDTVHLDALGQGSITPAQVDNGSTDNCGTPTLTLDISTFNCGDIANNPIQVVLTGTDTAGNSDTAQAFITVLDTVRPQVITQDFTVYLNGNGLASITSTEVNNGSNDACGIATLTIDSSNFDCTNLSAPVTVTLTVTDVNGNSNFDTAVVTILDSISPVAQAQNLTIQLDSQGLAIIDADSINNGSTDNCSISTIEISTDTFTCANAGTPVSVTLTVTDQSGNVDTDIALVTVQDLIAPHVLTQNDTFFLDGNGQVSIVPANIDSGSWDSCGIASYALDISDFDCTDLFNPVTVNLTVTDVNGNSNSDTAIVVVEDTTSPQALVQNITVQLDSFGLAVINADSINNNSTDNCSISTLSIDIDSFDCGDVGAPVQVTLTVTDQSGNSNDAIATVTVEDNIAPHVFTQDLTVYIDTFGTVSITPTMVDNGSWDSCGISTITLDSSTFSCANVNTPVTVTLTVTDMNGNTNTETAIITVEDSLGPIVLTQPDTFYLGTNGSVTVPYQALDAGSFDNCELANISLSDSVFNCSFADSTVNIWLIASDTGGNVDSAIVAVTIYDTLHPVITCPADLVVNNDPGQCGAVVTFSAPGAADNCSIDSVIQIDTTGIASGDLFPVGISTLRFVAYDPSGNTDTCSFTIEVIDTIVPVITCLSDTAICDAVFNFSLPTYTDNCTGHDVVQIAGLASGSAYPVGTTTNTFVVTDDYGNSDTCSFEVLRYEAPSLAVVDSNIAQCEASLVTISANNPGVGSGSWSLIQGSGTIADTSANVSSISNLPTGLTQLVWTVRNGVCAPERDTMSISIFVSPSVANVSLTQVLCNADSAIITADAPAIGVGTWSTLSNSAIITNSNANTTSVTNLTLDDHEFIWQVDNGVCPASADTVLISNNPFPVINTSLDLNIFASASVPIEVFYDLGVSFDWLPKTNIVGDTNELAIVSPAQTTTYRVTVTSAAGCASSDSVTINVNDDLEIPTAFTPDGDGVNDRWVIEELQFYPDCQINVFDRNGTQIFSSVGYNTPWDGTFNGEMLPNDSYFFVINLKTGLIEPITGSITIIK